MEINANIYIITDSQEFMEKAEAILSRETDAFFDWETIAPHPILPLTRTWYTCETNTGPTTGPSGWEDCLQNALLCSRSVAQSSCGSGVQIIPMTIVNMPTRPLEEM